MTYGISELLRKVYISTSAICACKHFGKSQKKQDSSVSLAADSLFKHISPSQVPQLTVLCLHKRGGEPDYISPLSLCHSWPSDHCGTRTRTEAGLETTLKKRKQWKLRKKDKEFTISSLCQAFTPLSILNCLPLSLTSYIH